MRARVVDPDGTPISDWMPVDDSTGRYLMPFAILLERVRANMEGLRECELEIDVP